jgi:hypothetical protein
MNNADSARNRRNKDRKQEQQKKRSLDTDWRAEDEQETTESWFSTGRATTKRTPPPTTQKQPLRNGGGFETFAQDTLDLGNPSMAIESSDSIKKMQEARVVAEKKEVEKLKKAEEAEKKALEVQEADRLKALKQGMTGGTSLVDEAIAHARQNLRGQTLYSGTYSSEDEDSIGTDEAYDSSKEAMRTIMAKVIKAADAAYKDHEPIQKLWTKAHGA